MTNLRNSIPDSLGKRPSKRGCAPFNPSKILPLFAQKAKKLGALFYPANEIFRTHFFSSRMKNVCSLLPSEAIRHSTETKT